MSDKKLEKPACSVTNAAVPDVIECPGCGEEIEMWSDETESTCKKCGKAVSKK